MVKSAYFIFATLTIIIIQSDAISFVNNVTIPSDFLTKILFDGIRNKKNTFNITVKNTKIYDSEKCISGLREIVNRFPNIDVLPCKFFGQTQNISVKILKNLYVQESNHNERILKGHLQDLGHFDQCIETSVVLNEDTGLVNGQYCFASIPFSDTLFEAPPLGHEIRVQKNAYEELLKISIAVCVPDTCHPSLVKVIIQEAADSMFHGALAEIIVDRCKTAKKSDFKPINIIGIVIFSVFAALIVLSTVYDVYSDWVEKPAIPILLAFSVLTNGRKLFDINTSKSPNSIECLTGIRVLSMIWVVFCHNYSLSPMLPLLNIADLIDWFNRASTMHITMATVSVDSFFFLSGLLLAWLGFRELDKSNGKLDVLMMYFHRYIRLTPPVAAVMLFILSINHYIGTGPYRTIFENFHDGCITNWWSTLLYIQNYANPSKICVAQTWYLAVDTQLYVLSPLILIPLWKWGRKFIPIMVVLSVLSIGCVIAAYLTEGYTQFIGVLEPNQMRLTYGATHTRYSVWMLGIGFGYFMHQNRHKHMRPSKMVQLLGWFACFAIILVVIYVPYFKLNSDGETTSIEAGLYESLKRVAWGAVLSWIVFACHFGFGGLINSFLSHHCWQPLGRLTYSMYLVHMIVQSINYGTTRTDVYYSDYSLILLFWGNFGISLLASIVLTLAFESPVLVIEKSLLRAEKERETRQPDFSEKKVNI